MGAVDGLAEGHIVNDRFQLLRLLGRGGMGSVWVAQHLTLNIEVAIKFIESGLEGREDLRSRFAQEARTAARIQSPHVVSILDYGFDTRSRPFIAMELLQGEPLSARIERETRLPLPEVARILSQAAKGLTRAHALGIVHRDLKPDNLFLCRDEEGVHTKLLDFGIARDDTPLGSASHRTGTGQLLGTPAYMSPEQALGRGNIDFRSDLYSLAVVVYRCITGRLPFESEALGELIVSISMKDPPLPSTLMPLPPGIDGWFKGVFQKDPNARYGSAKEMSDLFAAACGLGPGSAMGRVSDIEPPNRDVNRATPGLGNTPLLGQPAAQMLTPTGPQQQQPWSTASSASNASSAVASGPKWSTSGTAAMSAAPPMYPASMAGTPAPSAHTVAGRPGQAEMDPPTVPTSGPTIVMYGLISLGVLLGIAGAGAYMMKSRADAAAALPPSGVDAPQTNVAPQASSSSPPPSYGAAAPSPTAPAASSAASPSVSASASASASPAAPPPPRHPHGASPAPVASSPPAPVPAPPRPATPPPPAHTNDYGL
jgi:serine/threonine-protein kinase